MAPIEPITPEMIRFITQLRKNNNREWFQKNKSRYDNEVRAPLLRFIEGFGPLLYKISPHFVADARGNGGSLFRIYRDTRFSRDKTPYKTHLGIQFRHERVKDVHAPGFYLHIEPRESFVGVGMWRPDSDALGKVRDAIVDDSTGWKKASTNKKFLERYELTGDSLKRAPKGFDPDHPLIDDLRRKDFIAVAKFDVKETYDPKFATELAKTFKAATPFMKFLTQAVKLEW
jgi:uncharacterized protein (TIGR02453 family)